MLITSNSIKEAKSIKIKQTRKIHKQTRFNRFLVKDGNFVTDRPDVIHIEMGNGSPTLRMEIVDSEISLWVLESDGKLILRQPVYDTAIIDFKKNIDTK